MQGGLPALRHDWRYSAAGDAIGATLAGFSSGWLPEGLGSVQPYPTLYLVGFALWPLTVFANAIVMVTAIIGAAIFIASRAAMKIGAQGGGTGVRCSMLAVLAAVNPWVYSEMVAGHIEMVLAFSLLLALVAELTRKKPRTVALLLLAAFSISQIEFLAIVFVPLTVWCIYMRRYAVLAALFTAVAPIVLGIVASYDVIRATPYMLPWQAAASVPLNQGSVLLGYEFGYAKPFEPFLVPLAMLGVFSGYGMLFSLRHPIERLIITIAIAALIFASGTAGPIAPLYAWCVLHVPESGLFRELYDLIAFAVIAYVVSLARVPSTSRAVDVAVLFVAATLCIPWIAKPIADWTVPAASIPTAAVESTPQTRVALFPAFQPVSFNGRGSGFDPDAFVRAGKADPLNEFYPTFPVNAALGSAESEGDTRALIALGVKQVVVRPYLASRRQTLRYQLIEAGSPASVSRLRSGALNARPLLSLVNGLPAIVSIGNDPGENAVFFGDLGARGRKRFGLPSATYLVRYEPSRAFLNLGRGWVDARLAIDSKPQWGTAFGGVATSSDVPLDTKNAVAILAQASGALLTTRGKLIASTRSELHWWRLPGAGTRLRCHGTCVVIMGATELPALPEHAAASWYRAATGRTFFPWLVAVKLPRDGSGTLRYAVRYDRHWVAFRRGRILPHLRLAMALNGWLIDDTAGGTVYLVEWLALLQAILESVCIATVAALTISVVRPATRTLHRSN